MEETRQVEESDGVVVVVGGSSGAGSALHGAQCD